MSTFRGILFVVLILAALPLGAQNLGEITGTVADASGAVVAGAAVTVTNTSTNQVRRTVTNDTGTYSAPFLVPGLYEVRVEKAGFKVGSRRGVDLQVGAVARIDFNLEVGEVSQQVEVTGGAPLTRHRKYGPRHGHREPADCGAAAQRPQLSATGHVEP